MLSRAVRCLAYKCRLCQAMQAGRVLLTGGAAGIIVKVPVACKHNRNSGIQPVARRVPTGNRHKLCAALLVGKAVSRHTGLSQECRSVQCHANTGCRLAAGATSPILQQTFCQLLFTKLNWHSWPLGQHLNWLVLAQRSARWAPHTLVTQDTTAKPTCSRMWQP